MANISHYNAYIPFKTFHFEKKTMITIFVYLFSSLPFRNSRESLNPIMFVNWKWFQWPKNRKLTRNEEGLINW